MESSAKGKSVGDEAAAATFSYTFLTSELHLVELRADVGDVFYIHLPCILDLILKMYFRRVEKIAGLSISSL
ncbi:hypothetical protein Cni_G14151 [Canna indica]|uniref:Uncharacterized protein n=1 Tax=Canna indica TaxID=4628 RepID=A0AAQ3KBD2_9LILI|nr:hypothetical protein Cni_G14151 [Canna indica]